jgi:hypothetical protein
VTGPLEGLGGRLADLAEQLGVSLGQWAYRDEAADPAAAVRAGGTALETIDAMLAGLHKARSALVTEIRADQDATAARVDAMLAERRERRDGAS